MEYRRMGRSGLQLSVLSFGSWVTFSTQIDDGISDRLMGVAYDAGVNFFDNAETYAGGESEEMMGRVLRKKNWDRSSYVVSSKVFFGVHGKENKPNQRGLGRKHLVEACHAALRRLQLEYLDLYYCHRPDKQTTIEEVVRTMNTLIQQGKVLYWGTSEWSAAEIVEAHAAAQRLGLEGPVVEQPEYNLFNRQKMEADYLTIFNNFGMGTTIWSPLASGLLTGKYNDGIPAESRLGLQGYGWLKDRFYTAQRLDAVSQLQRITVDLGVSMAAFSIAWCVRNPHVTSAILGATKVYQLEENLKALEVLPLLTDEVMGNVEAVVQTKPTLPEY